MSRVRGRCKHPRGGGGGRGMARACLGLLPGPTRHQAVAAAPSLEAQYCFLWANGSFSSLLRVSMSTHAMRCSAASRPLLPNGRAGRAGRAGPP